MDTHRLKIFLNLLETGNCSETAEQLFTTQSTVSKQIQSLEKEPGFACSTAPGEAWFPLQQRNRSERTRKR